MRCTFDPVPLLVFDEAEVVKLTSDVPSEDMLIAMVTSFAANDGGLLLIGADSDGTMRGVPRNDTSRIRQKLSTVVESLPFEGSWHIGAEQLGDRAVVFLEVQPGLDSDEYLSDAFTSALAAARHALRSPQRVVRVELLPIGQLLADRLREDASIIHQLSPDQFEEYVCDRLAAMGLEPQRVGRINQRDGGIDILFWPRSRDRFPFLGAAQVKHRKPERTIGPATVREFAAAIANQPISAGLIVTNTTFTPDVRWFAQERAKLLRLRELEDVKRWIRNDFASEHEWREIPSSIELAPGLILPIKLQR